MDETKRSRRILRLKQVRDVTGLCTSAIYARIADGAFPRQVPLGGRAVGWFEDEIDTWLEQCGASRDKVD